MRKYVHKVLVRKIISYIEKGYEKVDRSLVLTLLNETTPNLDCLDCFNHTGEDFDEGKEYLVWLRLCCFKVEKQDGKEKKAVYIKSTPTAVNRYDLFGQVIDRKNGELILDCGFYVFITGYENIKVGDWIKANGRLDVLGKRPT